MHGTEATIKMIESPRNINKEHVKALMLVESLADRVARVAQQYKACPRFEVLDNRSLTLRSHDAGSVKHVGAPALLVPELASSFHQRARVDSAV